LFSIQHLRFTELRGSKMAESTYNAIGTVTLTSAQSRVSFVNIPQIYTDLVLVVSLKAGSGQYPILLMQLDGDESASYSRTYSLGDGTTISNGRSTSINQMYPGPGTIGGITDGTNQFSIGTIQIMNYSSNSVYKTVISTDASPYNSATLNSEVGGFINAWSKTSAVNSIYIGTNNGANYDVGSTFSLYGIGANTLKARGGDIIVSDGAYWYHAFTSSGTFTPNSSLSCDVLVVAGGGAGGGYCGGGGAGGVAYQASRTISSASAVTVGAGGSRQATVNQSANGASGSNSVFDTITANGGGGGGSISNNGTAGGSGGGGANGTSGGAATQGSSGGATGYGFAGGNGLNAPTLGGGGGGAGAVGANAVAGTNAGNGGIGLDTWSAWLTATGLGISGYIAGGGGGGSDNGTTVGRGGFGGGTAGSSGGTVAANAMVNTGGGGGGSQNPGGVINSGGGGSGLVVVRYAV
jgi:hypothetical protein